jgi:Sec-independent protein translocase protein TatA
MPVMVHMGFWTYLLIVAVVLIVVALALPSLFKLIVDAISELARAFRGESQLAPFFS